MYGRTKKPFLSEGRKARYPETWSVFMYITFKDLIRVEIIVSLPTVPLLEFHSTAAVD